MLVLRGGAFIIVLRLPPSLDSLPTELPVPESLLATVSAPLVECSEAGLRFETGVEALRGITWQAQAGEIISLVGPSGCGKSTLLRLLAGLIEPTSGTVQIHGQSPRLARQSETSIGFVFQEATLLPWRTVTDNVRLPLELQGLSRAEQQSRIDRALQLVGLEQFAAALPAQLSGGMRMRAALIRALVTEPELLLLDEPFGALDDITRQRLNEELLGLWQQRQWTGVFVTHNVFEAVYLSHRVLVLSPRPGRIVAELQIPFAFPRDPELRSTVEFARAAAEISQLLRKTA